MAIDPVSLAASSGLLGGTTGTGLDGSLPSASGLDGVGAIDTGSGTQLKRSGDVSNVYGLGRDDFLKLLLAQLQNQDPTQPVDDKEMLSELAQFTMIDTLQGVQKSLEGSQLAQASSLIGKTVTGSGTDGKPLAGVVDSLVQDSSGIALVVGGRSIAPDSVTSVSSVRASTGSSSG